MTAMSMDSIQDSYLSQLDVHGKTSTVIRKRVHPSKTGLFLDIGNLNGLDVHKALSGAKFFLIMLTLLV